MIFFFFSMLCLNKISNSTLNIFLLDWYGKIIFPYLYYHIFSLSDAGRPGGYPDVIFMQIR